MENTIRKIELNGRYECQNPDTKNKTQLGMDGLGGEMARWEFTKMMETLYKMSLSGGNGARCAKYFCANCSSDGRK